ncbi:hypothetical protein [Amycolatopsis orientalis]|uniref:hypothetical protein n=1 Tax=Amycolatopsis orientalis TaxID=31958 RepID=UPI000559C12F|nr:hypothetical protein [Amycolatopsis orientalis]
MTGLPFVRFQSPTRNERGTFTGVFGLVNGLAKAGRLTAEQEAFRRANNDWYDANFINPAHTDPSVYDVDVNPGAAAWFKATAQVFIERVDGYLSILETHGIPCETVWSADPGVIVYEDEYQVVVVAGKRKRGLAPAGQVPFVESGSALAGDRPSHQPGED